MILVQDLDLVPSFTNCHTAIRAPEMFDHAIFADAEIPLRTRIFLGLRNRLLFLLQIPGRQHQGCLCLVLVVVAGSVHTRRNILVISSHFIFPVKGIIVLLLSTWDRRLVRGRQMPSKDVLECKSLLEGLPKLFSD